jgi:hypothetical protein
VRTQRSLGPFLAQPWVPANNPRALPLIASRSSELVSTACPLRVVMSVIHVLYYVVSSCEYLHIRSRGVSIDGVWIGNRIYWTLPLITTSNCDSLTELHTAKTAVTTAHVKPSHFFTIRCLVTAFNGRRFPYFGFPNCLRPQLPAFHLTKMHLSTSELYYDRRSVGQPVLVSGTHPLPKTRFLLLTHIYWFIDLARPL